MNNERRKRLDEAEALINEAKEIVEEVESEEEEAFSNLPESIQGSEKGEKMEETLGYIQDLVSELENLSMSFDSARGDS